MNNNKFEFDGYCAFAISTGKTDVKGEKQFWTKNGKTYVFSNPVARFLFKILPNRINKANEIWNNK